MECLSCELLVARGVAGSAAAARPCPERGQRLMLELRGERGEPENGPIARAEHDTLQAVGGGSPDGWASPGGLLGVTGGGREAERGTKGEKVI